MVLASTADASIKPTIKFFCSYGGKIAPRHPDGELRYLGGETRVIAVHHYIPFSDLQLKIADLCGTAVSLRCQLPTEDLDSLVSITCDDDLTNLYEECDRIASPTSPLKIKAFLFPPKSPKNQVPTAEIPIPPHLSTLSSPKSPSSSSSACVCAAACGSCCSPSYWTMPRAVLDRSPRHKMLLPLRDPLSFENSKGKSVNPHPVPHPQYCYSQHHGNTARSYIINNGNNKQCQ